MVSLCGPWRRKSAKVSSVKEWWWMGEDEGKVEPTQVDARRGRCAVCALRRSRGSDGSGGSEGEGNEPI